MRLTKKISLGLVFTVLALIVISPTAAEATTYEFESVSGWLFSPDQTAIEEITGQPSLALPTQVGIRYFVPGSMRGSFTYEPGNADAPLFYPPRFWAHPFAMTAWSSELEVGGNVIGTYTGDAGQVIIAEGNDGPGLPDDLVNVQMCGYCTNPVGFSIGHWKATGSGFLWAGEGFQEGIELPSALPPTNAPEAISIFSFFNPVTGVNASILSFDASIWEAAQIVDIDIKPGSEPNCFNINGRGVVPVAVLGSPDLDIAHIDQATLKFGGLDVGMRGNRLPMCGIENINDDGYSDLVCQFEDDSSAWAPGNEEASLTGELLDGSPIKGTDSICLKP